MPIVVTESEGRTFLDLQNEVLDHGFDPARYRERIKRWLNDALHRVRRRAKLADAEVDSALSTVAGTREYEVPAAAIRVRSLRHPAESRSLAAISINTLDELPAASGKPTAYALHANKVLLYPTPDAAWELSIRNWSNSDRMVADGDPVGLHDDYTDVLVSFALGKAYLSEDDPEMAVVHRQDFDRGLLELLTDMQLRQVDRIRQIPGMFAGGSQGPGFTRPGV